MDTDDFIVRPIDRWPGPLTAKRKRSQFRAGYADTLRHLRNELRMIKAKDVILLMAIRERDLRLDGRPRADAKPDHPGCILTFVAKHGPMQMAVDRYERFEENLRAIAFSLEALRAVDRHGCTRNGEQYRGWLALPAPDAGPTTVEEARQLVIELIGPPVMWDDPECVQSAFREAAKLAHPDGGGSEDCFKRLMMAKEILLGE